MSWSLFIIGKGDDKFTDKGHYTLSGNILTLSGDDKQEKYYKVGENRLIQLEMDKNEITGELTEHYILKKPAGITENNAIVLNEADSAGSVLFFNKFSGKNIR